MLLVNDDAASLFALETLLVGAEAEHPYELMTAASGKEALRQVLLHDFAVILLDVAMPGMDGFETAEAIHSHPRAGAVPIIFITAHYADEFHRLKAYQKGAADYLFTPVIPQILQSKVNVFVELTKKNLELAAKSEELARLNQDLRAQRLQDLERINRELELEVAERKQAESRAHELSIRDSLTGLINRRSIIQQLEHAAAHADRHQGEFALLYLDLDRFKNVNDTLGHEVGDELLRQVAVRLLAAVRVSDLVARLGGDEFIVLLEGRGASSNAARVARKIEQASRLPFDIGGHRIRTSTSIGIGLYPQDADNAATLIRHADIAMYHAKQHKRGGVEFFREELNAREVERARWAGELQHALDHDELTLRFAPRAEVEGGALAGIEALLYWRHPDHGLLPAARFLPAVADRQLLDKVSDWTIAAVCEQAASLRAAALPLPDAVISVNLAAIHLQADLAQRIEAQLRACDLPDGWLELEIAEHLLVGADDVEPVLRGLHHAGVRLAVDDFGSAGASLATLRALPFDTLKIDRAFIEQIGQDGGDDMLAAIIHLGRALGLAVVAQGVAQDGQLTLLRSLGCDQYQGDLLSEHLDPDGVAELLRQAAASGAPPGASTIKKTNPRAKRVAPSTPKKPGPADE
ncbi:MAG: EAL domain-containing protein [Massilia sp.]